MCFSGDPIYAVLHLESPAAQKTVWVFHLPVLAVIQNYDHL